MNYREINFDGLVGPTHNYAGLSVGNRASIKHVGQVSNPKEAALQGLSKMRSLMQLGLHQAILLPHERPHLPSLRALGFIGNDVEILKNVAKTAPSLLSQVSSASSMWTANAGIVTPSLDSHDGKVHFTAANLVNKYHRSLEADFTSQMFRKIFANETFFSHHEPLPRHECYGDEGAANHTRLCQAHGQKGFHFLVYGKKSFEDAPCPTIFPARQSFEASLALSKLHQWHEKGHLLLQQNPQVIDKGVFHHDVIGVGNENTLFIHEDAFFGAEDTLRMLCRRYCEFTGSELNMVTLRSQQLTVEECVATYLFNSQLVTLPGKTMALICPVEVFENARAKLVVDNLISDNRNSVSKVCYLNLRESMKNGGGPACLRVRMVLNEREIAAMSGKVMMTLPLVDELELWVHKHYRDTLSYHDLQDPNLYMESCRALDELTQLLCLPSLYSFQK